MHRLKTLTYFFIFLSLSACQHKSSDEQEAEAAAAPSGIRSSNVVAVQLAESKVQNFPLQVLATGK